MTMKRERKGTIESILTDTVRFGALFVLAVTVIIMLIAAFDNDTAGEASIGSFESGDFNEGWSLMFHGERQTIDLPMSLECEKGDEKGCYVFVNGSTPVYVGKTNASFRQEIFASHKRVLLNKLLTFLKNFEDSIPGYYI